MLDFHIAKLPYVEIPPDCYRVFNVWGFPKIVVPQNGWFIMENHIKMDDLGGKPTIFGNPHIDFHGFPSCWGRHISRIISFRERRQRSYGRFVRAEPPWRGKKVADHWEGKQPGNFSVLFLGLGGVLFLVMMFQENMYLWVHAQQTVLT